MAKITLQAPDTPYSTEIDTGVMEVNIKDTFVGVQFTSPDGEILHVAMRDSGFEVRYQVGFGEIGFDSGWIDMKNGHIKLGNKEKNE